MKSFIFFALFIASMVAMFHGVKLLFEFNKTIGLVWFFGGMFAGSLFLINSMFETKSE